MAVSTTLLSLNRIAQFAARFEMQEDGSVAYYHPDRATGGLPCTLEECEKLIDDYTRTYRDSMKWMIYWAIVSGITLGLLEASETWVTTRWVQYAIMLAPFPLVIYLWYQAGQKPLQLLGTRLHCSPPRSVESAFWSRVRALPASLFLYMSLPSGGLVYYAIEDGWEKVGISSLVIVGCNLLMTVVWLYARWIRK